MSCRPSGTQFCLNFVWPVGRTFLYNLLFWKKNARTVFQTVGNSPWYVKTMSKPAYNAGLVYPLGVMGRGIGDGEGSSDEAGEVMGALVW